MVSKAFLKSMNVILAGSCFSVKYESSNCQNMSKSSPPDSKSIFVVSQMAFKYMSYPIKEQSIIGFGYDGAKADSSIISSLA